MVVPIRDRAVLNEQKLVEKLLWDLQRRVDDVTVVVDEEGSRWVVLCNHVENARYKLVFLVPDTQMHTHTHERMKMRRRRMRCVCV